jgi:hypothetical protein
MRAWDAAAAAALALVVPIVASAQFVPPSAKEANAARNSPTVVSPDLASPIRSSAPTVVFQAEEGKEKVSAQAGLTSGYWNVILKAAAPLNTDADDTELGGLLDGFNPGTTLTLTLGGQRWGPERRKVDSGDWCRSVKTRLPAGFNCSSFVEQDVPEELRDDYLLTTALAYTPIFYALEASAGPRSYSFADPATLEPGDEEHWDAGVTGAVGVVTRSGILLSGGVSYTSAYRAGRKRNVCTPLPVEGALQCRDLVLGEPQHEEGFSGLAEMKTFVSRSFAVNPRVRFTGDDWVAEAPLYFLPASAGGLIGGVTPRYSSETDRFGLVLFVGKAFGLTLTKL